MACFQQVMMESIRGGRSVALFELGPDQYSRLWIRPRGVLLYMLVTDKRWIFFGSNLDASIMMNEDERR